MHRRLDLLPLALTAIGLVALVLAGYASGRPDPVAQNQASAPAEPLPSVPTLAPEAVAAGAVLYQAHCASCHGANLEGQPNWKKQNADGTFPSPPHDDSGHTWHHPDALLTDIIRNGGNGNPAARTNMTAFGAKLSDADIQAVLAFIKSKWSAEKREFQWQMSQ